MRKLTILISVLCAFTFAQDEQKKVAIYIAGDVNEKSINLRMVIDDAFVNNSEYRIVTTSKAAAAVAAKEMGRQTSGSVRSEKRVEMGNDSEADYVCAVQIRPPDKKGEHMLRIYIIDMITKEAIPGKSKVIISDLEGSKEILRAGQEIAGYILGTSAQSGGNTGRTAGGGTCPSDMVFVKGGTFTMGCTSEQSNCENNERPTHSVTVGDFCIGKYEVTQKEWMNIMGGNPSSFKNCGDNCPVEMVSWNDVQEFTRKLSRQTGKDYRLPTEAEWEYAARGGNNYSPYLYSGSNSVDNVGWYSGNSGNTTRPVGRKAPNELGIYDMSGNVWEWVSDWYDSGYYGRFEGNNPKGPNSGSHRVLRGGSWNGNAQYCRVAFRSYYAPVIRSDYGGFRLALSL